MTDSSLAAWPLSDSRFRNPGFNRHSDFEFRVLPRYGQAGLTKHHLRPKTEGSGTTDPDWRHYDS